MCGVIGLQVAIVNSSIGSHCQLASGVKIGGEGFILRQKEDGGICREQSDGVCLSHYLCASLLDIYSEALLPCRSQGPVLAITLRTYEYFSFVHPLTAEEA